VTAIIATYNYGRFLGEAIESVLAQTLRPDEIIVVDDGSTDDTSEVAARYAHEGVRYIYQENSGVSAARNAGIRAGTGEFIAFLDGDDRWVPEKTAWQVEHLQRHPDVGLITGSEWQTDEAGRKVWRLDRKASESECLYPRILVENTIGSTSLVMVRRECLERVGMFDEQFGPGQDWDLWIRIAGDYPVGIIGEPLMLYRRHGANMSATGSTWKRYFANRAFQRQHIRPLRPALLRLRLLTAAQSMNLFYTAAAIDDTGTRRGTAVTLALIASLLDPTYHLKLKLGLLARATFGKDTFSRLRRALPGRV
jgi:glycosyltransferase involved in cell wall biosynthesis